MVAHACNPSYEGGRGRMIIIQSQLQAKMQDPM
jgi:hypothetical protein